MVKNVSNQGYIGFYRHDNSCSSFVRCVLDEAKLIGGYFTCPTPLYFDTDRCVWPEERHTGNGVWIKKRQRKKRTVVLCSILFFLKSSSMIILQWD